MHLASAKKTSLLSSHQGKSNQKNNTHLYPQGQYFKTNTDTREEENRFFSKSNDSSIDLSSFCHVGWEFVRNKLLGIHSHIEIYPPTDQIRSNHHRIGKHPEMTVITDKSFSHCLHFWSVF